MIVGLSHIIFLAVFLGLSSNLMMGSDLELMKMIGVMRSSFGTLCLV